MKKVGIDFVRNFLFCDGLNNYIYKDFFSVVGGRKAVEYGGFYGAGAVASNAG